MDITLDEDFMNFESVSQTCNSSHLTSVSDEELRLLDNEVNQREQKFQGNRAKEENNNDIKSNIAPVHIPQCENLNEMKTPSEVLYPNENMDVTKENRLFTTFSYNSTNKRLTMIPAKYKIKEERRKVLKISVNKLKKIDDPESWLCRSVLINNTMKKLQKETRQEKISKHLNTTTMYCSVNCLSKSTINNNTVCSLNNNNDCSNEINGDRKSEHINNIMGTIVGSADDSDTVNSGVLEETISGRHDGSFSKAFYTIEKNEVKECLKNRNELGNGEFYENGLTRTCEFKFPMVDSVDCETHKKDIEKEFETTNLSRDMSTGGEVLLEKMQTIRRCSSRKKSLDEDGAPNDILNLNRTELILSDREADAEDMGECDVRDVLSQLYIPPTPRRLNSTSGDVENEDELDVVDVDSCYVDGLRTDCLRLSNDDLFDSELLAVKSRPVKRDCENDNEDECDSKRRKGGEVLNYLNACELVYDNFLSNNKRKDSEKTREEGDKVPAKKNQVANEELIELEDEEDIERRISQSLISHYHRKQEKTCENFFEETCDNQYSCGHMINMFSDLQSVTFHNLIAGLET